MRIKKFFSRYNEDIGQTFLVVVLSFVVLYVVLILAATF